MLTGEFFGNTLTAYLFALAAFLVLLWVLLLAKRIFVSRLRALCAAAGIEAGGCGCAVYVTEAMEPGIRAFGRLYVRARRFSLESRVK